jgi:cephalosporin hydroxylase
MDPISQFNAEKAAAISKMANDKRFRSLSSRWFIESVRHRYTYDFTWLGRPIIQYPQDIVAMQEIIWKVQPDLIVETGIAHGGSLIFYASMLELIGGKGRVLGIDVDIRQHNRKEIEKHRMFKRIRMIEGSSTDDAVVRKVCAFARKSPVILLVLDSNHAYAHVLKELQLYSPLVRKGSYIVVFDTATERLPKSVLGDRPWTRGNSPMTAVHEFVKANRRFAIEKEIPGKLMVTCAPDGYLRCVRDLPARSPARRREA